MTRGKTTFGAVVERHEEAVDDAMKSRGVSASEGATVYVVGLLADFAKPGSPVERTLEKSLTLLLDEALNTNELAERFEKLGLEMFHCIENLSS